MTRPTGALILMLLSSLGWAEQADKRNKVMDALRKFGVTQTVPPERVSFGAVDFEGDPVVRSVRFDAALGAWIVKLRCAPPSHCVPFLAVVRIDDLNLIPSRSPEGKPLLVNAGDRKHLVSEIRGGRITEPVVCLQSGRAGQQIRVRVSATRLIRHAMITEQGNLRLATP